MSSKTGGLLSWDWAGVSLLGGVDLLVRGRHRGNGLRGGGREKRKRTGNHNKYESGGQ